jgi:hypothetical protein
MKYQFLIAAGFFFFLGCSHEDSPTDSAEITTITGADLYALGKSETGFTFYKHSPDTIAKAGGSGHPDPQLRTRYNSIAAKYLDGNGKVKAGTVFPDSSLIVKELFTDGVLTTYVYLFKKKNDANADANGWVWAESSPAGTPTYSVSNKGAGCTGCHGSGIDYTRMNDAHP